MVSDTLQFADLSGQTIKGYQLLKAIGKGGFGAVYRAYQPAVRRDVAIKVILPEYVNNPEFIRRFEAEAQLIAHLEHLHIVPLYDFWRDADGAFLVMRWLKGGSLRTALEKGVWPLADIARLVDQITQALAVAHQNGVIHRDLKPDNILLDESGNAYLADFGIARDLQNFTQLESLYLAEEQQGQIMGSPHYLSPEQIKSAPISAQSDIYSFGVVLYELLVGKTPFHGLPLGTVISRHLTDPLPPLHEIRSDLPDALNHIIAKATAKDPADRYPSILALNAEFRQAALAGTTDQSSAAQYNEGWQSKPSVTEVDELDDGIAPINPYKGLRPFQEADARHFYGRAAFTERLLERLRKTRFVAVVGPSGSGKSSAVKAGLLPELRQGALPGSEAWFIVEMTPGTRPLEELEAALLRVAVNPPASLLAQLREDERGLVRAVKRVLPGGTDESSELLLLIDQFEETFTQVSAEAERVQFLNILLAAAQEPNSRLRVVITLRADFYDRPLLYPDFGELIREHTEVILPLKRDELEQAIIQPAENAGMRLESNLASHIVVEVAEQPGALPLMQYALTELFERRKGRRLTLEAYQDIGGVSGALTRRADDLFTSLEAAGQQAAKQMFLRLVTINEGADDTRRRVRLNELLALQDDEAVMQQVIDQFGKYRLLTFDHDQETRTPTVEVAHEALIRQWKRLRGWLDENRDRLRIQRQMAIAAEEWQKANHDPSYLVSGARLDQFESLASGGELALNAGERAYLDACLKARVAETERRNREAAQKRRLRSALLAVLTVATVGALILSAIAFNLRGAAEANAATATIAQGMALVQADTAATAAAVARLSEAQARSAALASEAQLALNTGNTDLAIVLALQANTSSESTVETRRTLAEAVFAPGTRRVFDGHGDRVTTVAYRPDGTQAVSGGRDNTLIVWDTGSGQEIHRLEGHEDWIWDAVYSPDGKTILSGSEDRQLILWDAATGDILRRFEGHTNAVRGIAFNGDGTQAVSASTDSTLILWDVATGRVIRRIQNNSPIFDVAFSKTGFTALSGGEDGVVTLWNFQTGEPLFRLGTDGIGHSSGVWSVAYTQNEMGAISGSDDSSLILWSFETGQPVRRFEGHNSRVTSVAVYQQRAASASEDNSVIVWDMETGAIQQRFIGHTAPVYGVTFAPDGNHVLSASWDGRLRLWDMTNGAEVNRFMGHTDDVLDAAYSPDGQYALSASADHTLILWDTATGAEVQRLASHTAAVNTVAFSPDGKWALSGSDDFSLIVWDIPTGRLIRQMGGRGSSAGHSDAVNAVAVSPDGQFAVSGSDDNTLIVWDVATGEVLKRLFGHTFHITDVSFSPDGSRILSSGFDNQIILWDVESGTRLRQMEGHTDWIRAIAFGPDGQWALSGSADNTLILWDVETGTRLRQYEGHTAQVYSVAFSSDGKYILSGAADAEIILWEAATGVILRRLSGHTDDVRSVVFNADGRQALSASGDGTVRLWQIALSLDELLTWTRENRYIRELTCAERDLYRVEPLCSKPTPVLGPGSV